MKHIFTVERQDGTFAEVGMNYRWLRNDLTTRGAIRVAHNAAKAYGRRVRVETWADHEFYKPDVKPLVAFAD